MNKNMAIVSVLNDYRKKLSALISKKLGVMYLEVDDLVDYELLGSKKAIDFNGLEYYNKKRKKIVRRLFSYENVLISTGLQAFHEANINQSCEHTYIVGVILSDELFEKRIKLESMNRAEKDIARKLKPARDKAVELESDIFIILDENNIYNNRDKILKGMLGE